MLRLPSSCLRAKYIKTLPLNFIFEDPKSGLKYQVVEKKVNNNYVKVACHYFGNLEASPLGDISGSMMKIENPIRANITKNMKSKINQLETTVRDLIKQLNVPSYQRIKNLLDGDRHFETDDNIYCLHSGIIIPLRRKHYKTLEYALESIDDVASRLFKEPKALTKLMEKQVDIQSELFQLLMNEGQLTDEDETREITL